MCRYKFLCLISRTIITINYIQSSELQPCNSELQNNRSSICKEENTETMESNSVTLDTGF